MPFVLFSILQTLLLSLTVVLTWSRRITSDKSSYWQPNMYYEWENRTWSALQGVTNITVRPSSSIRCIHILPRLTDILCFTVLPSTSFGRQPELAGISSRIRDARRKSIPVE